MIFDTLKENNVTHSLLKKQLEKTKVQENDEQALAYLLEIINQTYLEHDKERRLSEHTMHVMSEEVMDANQDLVAQAEALKNSQKRYFLAASAANDGLWDWDIATGNVYFSSRWRDMLLINSDKKTEHINDWLSRVHADQQQLVWQTIENHIQGKTERIEVEFQIKTDLNKYIWVLVRGLADRNEAGMALRIAGSQTDITFRKEYEASLFRAAFHDELTGLANRALFMNRLDQVIARTKRLGEKKASLLFIDLDRFKYINDTLGHETGDEVLKIVANVLKNHTRATDTVGRLGGDEFTVLLEPIDHFDEAKDIADRILKQLNRPYEIDGKEIHIASSIGLTMIDQMMNDPQSVLRNADLAMYEAKSLGKSRLEIFDSSQHEKLLWRMQTETDLRYYVHHNRLQIYYQPIVDLQTQKIYSFEALLRWYHPRKGFISPAQFIPLAEEVGLIGKIGNFVLETVAKQIKAWVVDVGFENCPHVGVNISVRQLTDETYFKNILDTLESLGDYIHLMYLEITESVIMTDPRLIIERLKHITDLGVKISIDDFGTGYSSLSHLHNFPFEQLKIDREFISSMMVEKKTERLVVTILGMAQDLNLKTVAEGIETEEQMIKLTELGCALGQGYYFSKAVEVQDATNLLMKSIYAENTRPTEEQKSLP